MILKHLIQCQQDDTIIYFMKNQEYIQFAGCSNVPLSSITTKDDYVSNMLQDLGWRSLEQRRVDARLSLLYKIHSRHVPINASKYLQPMTRRSWHSLSLPVPHLTAYPSTPELSLNGTVYHSLFLILMTLTHSNIPSH